MNDEVVAKDPKPEIVFDTELGEIELIKEDDTPEEKRRKRDEMDKKLKEVEDGFKPTIDTSNK